MSRTIKLLLQLALSLGACLVGDALMRDDVKKEVERQLKDK